MRRFSAFLLTCVLFLPVLPAWAQPMPERPGRGPAWDDAPLWSPGPMWGQGRMGGWDGPAHPAMMILGPIVMLLALVGLIGLVIWLARMASHGRFGHHHAHWSGDDARRALGILAERFARGEIDKAEYEEKRRVIAG